MRLLEMVLHGCRRLMLNNIRTLRYKPSNMYQLILGTNGSGKSSVINEASPLPADPKDYIKGGYKYTKWEHRGSIYEIRSEFKTSSGKHSFIKDGVELNPGNTQTVSRELARQEFKITQDIHELITGQVVFTAMSTNERRKWLTMLCDTDFTFALGLFQKLSSAARDAQGASRHISDRLVTETNKLKALGDTVEWSTEAEILQLELEVLYRNRSNRNLSGNESRVAQLLDWECKMAERILSMGNPVAGRFGSLEEAKERLTAIDKEIELVKHSREWTTEALEDLQRLQKSVEGGGVGTLEEAQTELHSQKARRDTLVGLMVNYPDFGGAEAIAVLKSIESVREELFDVLKGIPNNSTMRFNKQTVQECREARVRLRSAAEGFTNRVAKEESTLEHLNGTCATTCPNCNHSWLPGNTEQVREAAQRNLTEFQRRLKETQDELKECEEYLEAAGEFSSYFQRYRGLVSNNPSLAVFWDRMLDVDGINSDPESWIREFSVFSNDASTYLEVETATRRIDQLSLSIEAMQKTDGGVQLKTRIDQSNAKIAALTEQLTELQQSYAEVSNILKLSTQLENMGHELQDIHAKREEAFQDYVVELRDDTIAEITRGHQSRLAFLNAKLSEKKTIEDLLSDLTVSYDDVKERQELYKLLADILSPKDGLIAEQMTGFIKGFTDHLNTITANIWTYDMDVLACGLESGELDYRFPVTIKGEQPIPDVSKGSRGQMEMFDFAFMLIVMFYLQLEEYPLYLDELGHFFDEAHKLAVMNFVKDLVETKGFSQVFMISHYASSHGAFTQAEVMVMDSSNISVPMKYNQHVTIE